MGKCNKKSDEKKEKLKRKKEKQELKSLKKQNKKNKTLIFDNFDSICNYYISLNKKDKYSHININNTSNNTFVDCEKPGPRNNCSITFINDNEFLLFGGEYNDNNELISYNDLFKYNIVKNQWKYYFTIDKKPKPRCAHQTVYFNKKVYIFGGELCTNSQFFHFNDLWCFDLKKNSFIEIEKKNKKDEIPSKRSGHRMILWKNCLVLFGGFFNNGLINDYYNDLYLYIINSNKWVNLTELYKDYLFQSMIEHDINYSFIKGIITKGVKNTDSCYIMHKKKFINKIDINSYIPCERSSVALFTDKNYNKIYIYGGYSQNKKKGILIGNYYNDIWTVIINYKNEDDISVQFKKLKKTNFQPSTRIGYGTCIYKNSLILFGGVFDKNNINENNKNNINNEKKKKKNTDFKEECSTFESIFFNDLYSFDMNKEQWFYLSLKNDLKKEDKNIEQNNKINNNKINNNNKFQNNIIEKENNEMEIFNENYKNENSSVNKTNFVNENISDQDLSGDDDYYSNVFVYFDEYGNKKTMKIEKENIKRENIENIENVENKIEDNYKNYIYDQIDDKKETNIISEKMINTENFNEIKNLNNSMNSINNIDNENNKLNKNIISKKNNNIKDNKKDDIENESNNSKRLHESESSSSNESSYDSNQSNSYEKKKKKFIINDFIEPLGRIGSNIFVYNKNLYLYGGMYEYKYNEIMLNDFWKISLYKRDKWKLLDKGNIDDINIEQESDSEYDKENISDNVNSNIDLDHSSMDKNEFEEYLISKNIKYVNKKLQMEVKQFNFNINETLNQFFLRTKYYWLNKLGIKQIDESKEQRKQAFTLCEKKYFKLKKYCEQIEKYKLLYLEKTTNQNCFEKDDNITDSSMFS